MKQGFFGVIVHKLKENANAILVMVAVAYGLYLACTSVVLWGGYTILLPSDPRPSHMRAIEYFVRNAAFPLSLFSAGLGSYLYPKSLTWRHPLVALSLFLIVPTVISAQAVGLVSLHIALIVCALCLGCGSGFMFCYLQELVASLKVFEAGIVVFAAAGISAAIYLLLGQLSRITMMWVGFLFLVPLMVIIVLLTRQIVPKSHPAFETIPQQQKQRCHQAALEAWPSIVCIAFSAFVVGIIRVESIGNAEVSHSLDNAEMLGLLIASVGLLASWKLIYERVKLSRIYQFIFPLTATMFLLLPLLDGMFRQTVTHIVFGVFSIMSSLMVVTCARIARNQSVPPVLVYGFFAGIVYAALELGSLLGYVLYETVGLGYASLSVVALIAIYCMSLTLNVKRRQEINNATHEALIGGKEEIMQSSSSFEERCARIVSQYSLSAREADVLNLFARGRDASYIAEELVISKNTVRTHIKSIFAKTGVHSHQELIDLVELSEK